MHSLPGIHFWVIAICATETLVFLDSTKTLGISNCLVNVNSKNCCHHPNSICYLGFPVHAQKETNKEPAVLKYFIPFNRGPKDKATIFLSVLHLHHQIYGRFSFVLPNSNMTNKESKYRRKVPTTSLCQH